jgi:hypothetical protein
MFLGLEVLEGVKSKHFICLGLPIRQLFCNISKSIAPVDPKLTIVPPIRAPVK